MCCELAIIHYYTIHINIGDKLQLYQWRNSYGLRVGKPTGTRAEGAPAGCPFTLVPAQITLSKSEVPFRTLFSLYSAKILITMHLALIDEIRIIWVPLQLGSRGGGSFLGICPPGPHQRLSPEPHRGT